MLIRFKPAILTGAMLAAGACAPLTDTSHLTADQIAMICNGAQSAQIIATGRQTGDLQEDYRCRSSNPGGVFDRKDRNVQGSGAARDRAIDRSMRGGR